MASIEPFIALLRSFLLETKGVEVVLSPDVLTDRLFMCKADWQRFAAAALQRHSLRIDVLTLTSTTTISDVYRSAVDGMEGLSVRRRLQLVLPYPLESPLVDSQACIVDSTGLLLGVSSMEPRDRKKLTLQPTQEMAASGGGAIRREQ